MTFRGRHTEEQPAIRLRQHPEPRVPSRPDIRTDPITFVGMIVLVAIVTVISGYLPARRASRIDPIPRGPHAVRDRGIARGRRLNSRQ